jgi:MoxR-like ATPase
VPLDAEETRPRRALRAGRVFANLLLADAIDRRPGRTAGRLLEAMQEMQVTLAGPTLPLPRPFTVDRDAGSVESDGTGRCPKRSATASCSRSSWTIRRWPTRRRWSSRAVAPGPARLPLAGVTPRLDARNVLSLQKMATHVQVDDKLVDYAVRIVRATRGWAGVARGASPRSAVALVRAARARPCSPRATPSAPTTSSTACCRRCVTA